MKLLPSILFRILIFIITNLPLISGIILFIYNNKIKTCNVLHPLNQDSNTTNLNQDSNTINYEDNNLYLDVIPIGILILSGLITLINLVPILSKFFLKIPHVYIIIVTFILVIPSAILYWYYLNIIDKEYNKKCIYLHNSLKTYLEIVKWFFTVILGFTIIVMLFFPNGRYVLYNIIKLILK